MKNQYNFETYQDMQALKELPGESSEDKILSFLKIKSEWGGALRHDSREQNVKKFGIYYRAEDEDEGGLLAFDSSLYPDVDFSSLKKKYLQVIDAPSIAKSKFWSDKDFNGEMGFFNGGGYIGFAWGDPDY